MTEVRCRIVIAMTWGMLFFPALVQAQKLVTFDKSRHPSLSSPNDIQQLFDDGADLLGVDDDDPMGSGEDDDVALDITFTINDSSSDPTFPDQSGEFNQQGQRGYDYTQPYYLRVRNHQHLEELLDGDFAEVKQIAICNPRPSASKGTESMVFTQRSIASSTVHEFGHCAGLDHRNTSNLGNDPIVNIMFSGNLPNRKEINRDERTKMENY